MTTSPTCATMPREPFSVRPETLTPALLASRTRVLTRIADEYHELTEPASHGGHNGNGGLVALTPHERHCLLLTTKGRLEGHARCTCAYRTVREFERLMREMREGRHALVQVGSERHSPRALRWHVTGWHVDARRLVRHYPKPRVRGQKLAVARGQEILRDRSGAWIPSELQEHVVRTHGARQDLARAGLEWMASHWREELGEPMLPADVREAA